jgi:Kef-type K+ transport system membrane component KefB
VTPAELSVVFFLQMFFIIAACRLVGWAGSRWLAQPQVVGEMIAGVLLGPSLLGMLAPDLQRALFPPESKSVLYVGAQLGVGLYMLLVGLGFRAEHFRGRAVSAVAVSLSGMAAPFIAAVIMTPWLFQQGLFGGASTWRKLPCSWARRSPSPPSPCWRGSSASGSWRTHR